jgi:hypothetical protein
MGEGGVGGVGDVVIGVSSGKDGLAVGEDTGGDDEGLRELVGDGDGDNGLFNAVQFFHGTNATSKITVEEKSRAKIADFFKPLDGWPADQR